MKAERCHTHFSCVEKPPPTVVKTARRSAHFLATENLLPSGQKGGAVKVEPSHPRRAVAASKEGHTAPHVFPEREEDTVVFIYIRRNIDCFNDVMISLWIPVLSCLLLPCLVWWPLVLVLEQVSVNMWEHIGAYVLA